MDRRNFIKACGVPLVPTEAIAADKPESMEDFEKGYWRATFDGTDNAVVIEMWSPQVKSLAIFILHYDPERGGLVHIDWREEGDTDEEKYRGFLNEMIGRFKKEIR